MATIDGKRARGRLLAPGMVAGSGTGGGVALPYGAVGDDFSAGTKVEIGHLWASQGSRVTWKVGNNEDS